MRRHLLRKAPAPVPVLMVVLALALAGCAREASVSLSGGADGEPEAAERPATGDAHDTDSGDGTEEAEAAGQDAASGEQAVAGPAEDPDAPVSSDGSATPAAPRKAPARQASSGGGAGGSTGSGTSGASGGGSGARGGTEPSKGVAVDEPHPDDPDGCPECQSPDPAVTPEPRPQNPDTEPRPGTDDTRAREWESAHVHADDVTITITWWSGVEPCHVLDRVEVDEQADRVVITLYEGSQPGYDGACTAQAVQKRTHVKLSSPLKGRAIVDGAKN